MRKKRPQLLVPSGGLAGGGLASCRQPAPAAAAATAAPGATATLPAFGRIELLGNNPVYSPDDSLAKAASKLAGLRALRASGPRPLGPQAAPPAAAPSRLAPQAVAAVAPAAAPAPEPCESPQPLQIGAHRPAAAIAPPPGVHRLR
jgi:hypothetical protein